MDSFPKTYNDPFKRFDFSLHVRESMTVLDSGFHAVDSGFLFSGTDSLAASGFQNPGFWSQENIFGF